MLKALVKKKIRELHASQVYLGQATLFVLSFLALLARLLWPSGIFVLLPLALIGFFLGLFCVIAGFGGDYVKEAHRFLEFLPIRRSAIWLVGYLTGGCLLCLSSVLLFGTGVLLFQPSPVPEFAFFVPGRFALVASGATILFWMFSIAVFPVASLDKGKQGATNVGVMMLIAVFLPIAVCGFLRQLRILPPATDLIPVLLISALLYSIASFSLFALMPRHLKRTTRIAGAIAAFLVCTAALFGHLYLKYLTWRTIGVSEPLEIVHVYQPRLDDQPNLILADVKSYRSGRHEVSIDVAQGTHHDLGRWLTFIEVHNNDSGLLHFVSSRDDGFRGGHAAVTMAPDATRRHSFRFETGRSYFDCVHVRWLQNPRRLMYPSHSRETQQSYLCVADCTGKILERFQVAQYSNRFVLSPTNQVLALAPRETTTGRSAGATPAADEKPYMIIDLDSGSVIRFDVPGEAHLFAKDLERVICKRERIQEGRRYRSYVLVDLPSFDERVVLPEEEFPPSEVTSQVQTTITPNITTDNEVPTPFLRVNDSFDTAFWVKQRVEGDYFRYSIVLIDLDTGQRQVVVPESETLKLPVVLSGGEARTSPVTVHRATADGDGLLFGVGKQVYLYSLPKQESALVADNEILLEASYEDSEVRYSTVHSPSGYRTLRFGQVYEKSADDSWSSQLRFAAIDVFREGKPIRLFRGDNFIKGVIWLDEERLIFYEEQAIYSLDTTGGSAQQIFPPTTTVDDR